MYYIIYIDIAGHSKYLTTEEEATKKLIERYETLIRKRINTLAEKFTRIGGDGFLIFISKEKAKPLEIINNFFSIIKSIVREKHHFKDSDFLPIRTGIHYGDIGIDEINNPNINEINNPNINIAQRLEHSALHNEIAVSEEVYDLLKDYNLNIRKDEGGLSDVDKKFFLELNHQKKR